MTVQEDGAYAALTEAPGGWVSLEGADMLYSRYAYGAEVGAGGRILEVGCGPGVGLGLLSASASLVVGADFDSVLLRRAQETYGRRIPLVRLDVQRLPFPDGAFDTILFYEGTYYIPDTDCAFDEIARVLNSGARMVFVNANPERPDFIPSPLSVHYHTAEEFRTVLENRGFEVSVEGAYPVADGTSRSRFLLWMRKLAQRLGFIPGTLAGRAFLKRMLIGKLLPVPEEVPEGFGRPAPRARIAAGSSSGGFKVLYVTAARKAE